MTDLPPGFRYKPATGVKEKFKSGQVVWARLIGFPTWPAVVTLTPETRRLWNVDQSAKYRIWWIKESTHTEISEKQLWDFPSNFTDEMLKAKEKLQAKTSKRGFSKQDHQRFLTATFEAVDLILDAHKLEKHKGNRKFPYTQEFEALEGTVVKDEYFWTAPQATSQSDLHIESELSTTGIDENRVEYLDCRICARTFESEKALVLHLRKIDYFWAHSSFPKICLPQIDMEKITDTKKDTPESLESEVENQKEAPEKRMLPSPFKRAVKSPKRKRNEETRSTEDQPPSIKSEITTPSGNRKSFKTTPASSSKNISHSNSETEINSHFKSKIKSEQSDREEPVENFVAQTECSELEERPPENVDGGNISGLSNLSDQEYSKKGPSNRTEAKQCAPPLLPRNSPTPDDPAPPPSADRRSDFGEFPGGMNPFSFRPNLAPLPLLRPQLNSLQMDQGAPRPALLLGPPRVAPPNIPGNLTHPPVAIPVNPMFQGYGYPWSQMNFSPHSWHPFNSNPYQTFPANSYAANGNQRRPAKNSDEINLCDE